MWSFCGICDWSTMSQFFYKLTVVCQAQGGGKGDRFHIDFWYIEADFLFLWTKSSSYLGFFFLYIYKLLGFKGEWFSPTSTMNEKNVEYIRDVTHKPNVLKFWVEMWRLPLFWSWSIVPLFLRSFPRLPNKWYKSLVQLGGGAGVDPSIWSTIGCGNSHYKGDC